MNNILTIAQKITSLETALNEICELKNDAFTVFCFHSLHSIKDTFETSWNEILDWNKKHSSLPRLSLDYAKIIRAFEDVADAHINRDEFESALKESCEKIEQYIEGLQRLLCSKKETLNKRYDEFAQTTGNYEFIFKEDAIKQLIINNLLKS